MDFIKKNTTLNLEEILSVIRLLNYANAKFSFTESTANINTIFKHFIHDMCEMIFCN